VDDAPRPIPEQLGNAGTPEERRTGIGGSDAPAAIGLSPWRSPLDLWEEKTGLAPPQEQTEPMLWGSLLEDVIRREYARRTGFDVQPVKELIRHPKHTWMFAHIDGEVAEDYRKIVEVKTTRDARGWGDPETDEIPNHYLVQVHHYLACTDAEVCDVAVLVGGQDFRIYQVRRDPQIEAWLIEQEAEFWDAVTANVPPEPKTLRDAVRRWGHFDAKGYIVAGEAEIAAVRTLKEIHRRQKELTTAEEGYKKAITEVLRESGGHLVSPDGELLATWLLDNGRKAYSVAARAPSRRFVIKNLEEAT
jgi:putative phage-type endonuclease